MCINRYYTLYAGRHPHSYLFVYHFLTYTSRIDKLRVLFSA